MNILGVNKTRKKKFSAALR